MVIVNTWPAPSSAGPVRATVAVPGSKSQTNRALVLAALAAPQGASTVSGALRSRDTDLMIGALHSLGLTVEGLGTEPVTFDGDEQARARPIAPLLDALRGLGVALDGDALPFRVGGTGAVSGGRVEIDASASSQFVSGLLLSGATFTDGLTVVH